MEHKSNANQPTIKTQNKRSNYQLARLSAYRSDHLLNHEAKGTSRVKRLARVQWAHPRHLANRNRATSIEGKWT